MPGNVFLGGLLSFCQCVLLICADVDEEEGRGIPGVPGVLLNLLCMCSVPSALHCSDLGRILSYTHFLF